MDNRVKEAQYLYKQLFGSVCPDDVARLYVHYDSIIEHNSGNAIEVAIDRIVSSQLDASAIEFALRLSRRRNRLTQKFGVLLYLGEMQRENVRRFTSIECSRLSSWFDLCWSGLIAVSRLIKGQYLLHRYSLVRPCTT